MAKDDFKKEIIKKVLSMDEKEEQEKILDSELNEIAGGVNKDAPQQDDLDSGDSCKCGIALACS